MKKLFRFLERETTLLSVIVFWLSLALISFLLLTDDSGDDGLFTERFGTVSYAKSSVRRKRASKFSWFAVDRESPVAVNDSVKTGADSAAIIEMEKGGTIEVGENSLVILKDTDAISNNFIQGSLIIRDASGDRRIKVDESGKRTEEKLSYRWVEPILQQEYITAPQKPLKLSFKWVESGGKAAQEKDLVFEFSNNDKFPPTASTSIPLEKSLRTHLQDLTAGRYFYRLRSPEGENYTETRVVKITELAPLNVSPVNVATFGDKANLPLTWGIPRNLQSVYSSGEHSLELAASEDFSTPLLSETISPLSGTYVLKSLGVGQYFARVKSKVRSYEYFGSVSPVKLSKTKKMQIEPLLPENGAVLDVTQPITFQWSSNPLTADPLEYVLELKEEGKTLLSQRLMSLSYSWKNPKEGKYSYTISAYLGDQKISESTALSFTVGLPKTLVLKSPRNGATLVSWPDESTISFEWAAANKKKYSSYNVEFSTSENFEKISTAKKTELNQLALSYKNIKEGTYYWRVVAQSEDGTGEQSKIYSFNYEYPELLSATSVKDLKKEYNLSKEKISNIRWKEVKNAKSYEVEIQRHSDNGRSPASVFSEKTTKTKDFFLPSLKEGTYVLTVWPIDPASRRGEPYRQKFEIRYGDLLTAPKLKKVEVE